MRHMPPAHTNIRMANTITENAWGRVPATLSFTPVANRISWTSPLAAASSAPTVMTQGRSPGRIGVSVARTAAFFCSERLMRPPAAGAGVATGSRRPRLRLRCPNAGLLTLERAAQRLGRAPGIARLCQSTDNRDALGPGPRHVGDVARIDAADGEEGDRGVGGGVAHEVKTHRRASRLGRRLVDGPDADVIHVARVVNLLRRMGREPDQALRSDGGARLGNRRVVLTHMDSVRTGGLHQFRPVVEDEQGAVPGARLADEGGRSQNLVLRRSLHPQLDDVDTARQRRLQELAGRPVTDEVEA